MRQIKLNSRLQILALAMFACAFSIFASNAAAQEYNPRDEFALTQGGTNGLWNYGVSTSDADNTVTLFAATDILTEASGCGGSFEKWLKEPSGDQLPQISRHNPAVTCANIPANAVFMHPGRNNQRVVLRFSAPTSGTFQIVGAFQKQNLSATTDLKIIKNGGLPGETVLYTGAIGAVYQQSFDLTATLTAGDKIDFSVGDGDNGQNSDGSTLAVTIGQPVSSCLTAPANLQVFAPGENSPSDVQSVNTNASLVGDATYTNTGKVGRAFDFDGNGDYVSIEDNPAQRPATAVTVEGWFKFNSASGVVTLVSKPIRNSAYNSYTLYLDGGQLRGFVGNTSQFTRVLSNFTPQTGVWHHLAFTYNFSGGVSTLKLYANGAEVTSGQNGTANLPLFYDANPFPLLIGGEFENNAPGFTLNGQADEVSVYSRALTQTEIFDIVQQGSFGKCAPAACAQTPQNLVSWYQGEQNAIDAKSNNHGTNNGATFQNGRVGQAFGFDGNDYVETPTLNLGSNYSLEFWIKPTADGTPRNVISNNFTSTTNYGGLYFYTDNAGAGHLEYYVAGGGTANTATAAGSVPTGSWSHVGLTYDGSVTRIYVNGVPAATGAPHTETFNNPLRFGSGFNSGAEFFLGNLDEISLYNRTLSALEIQSINNAGQTGKCKPAPLNPPANQVAWFTGDGETEDFTGLNPNGVLQGDANFRVGKVGQSFNFDGNGDFVEVANNANLNPTAALTLEGWVYKTAAGDADVFGKDGETFDRQYWVGAAANGRFRPHITTTGSGLRFVDGGTTYQLNTWYHVAMTYDGATLRLYVNGVEDGSISATGSITATTQPFRIGGGAPTGQLQQFFPGRIDEVSLYSRALSASEILAIYNAGTAGKLKGKTTGTGSDITVPLANATVTFESVTTTGTTGESSVDLGLLPKLPSNATFTGLAFDISTTATYQNGTADDVRVCFNLSSLTAIGASNLRILHLEGGTWIDRTATGNTLENFCTDNLASLSPFAIVQAAAPTAATAVISGRVTVGKKGLRNALMTLTESDGTTRTVLSGANGHYSFAEVGVGQNVILTVRAKRYSFAPNTQVINVTENVEQVNFEAQENFLIVP